MIVAAVAAVEMKDLISSVIALSAVGLSLSLAFLVLKAPNVAVTQLVIEILCMVILVRATIKRDLPLVKDGRWLFNTVGTLLCIAAFLWGAYAALKELPAFGEPTLRVAKEYLASEAKRPGVLNIVTAITLVFRNYDALGEAAILFAAIVGVLVITRKTGKAADEG